MEAAARGELSGSFAGGVLMADIRGFTSRFQDMAGRGTRGAEELSLMVNSTLSSVVSVCAGFGGFPVSFAGDAVTVVFPEGASRAEQARKALLSCSADDVLPIHSSLGDGRVAWNIIPMKGWSFYSVQGSAVSGATGGSPVSVSHGDDGSFAREKVSASFMDPGLFTGKLLSEFRHVTSLFVSQENRRGSRCPVEFQKLVLEAASQWGGFVSGLETNEDSYRMLAVFGAPVGREDDHARADRFLEQVFTGASGRVRAGASSGLVFCGTVSTPLLQSYTVLGPSVNLAARLHDAAGWNRVFAESSFNRTSTLQERRVRQIDLKGFSHTITVHQLHPWSRRETTAASVSPLIERAEILRTVTLQLSEPGGSVLLRGETGMGKTRMVEELRQMMVGTDFIHLKCRNPADFSSGDVFSRWFTAWLGGDDASLFREKLYGFVDRLEGLDDPLADASADELLRAESVLAALAGIHRERSLYTGLDPQGRFDNTVSVIAAFISGRMALGSTILVVDDLQNIDSDSVLLLSAVLAHPSLRKPSMLLLSGPDCDKMCASLGVSPFTMDLFPLSREGAGAFLEWKLGSVPSRELVAWFHCRTEGIPFYMEQYAEMLDSPDAVPSDESFPGNLHSLLVARLDTLEPGLRRLVLSASILGREFSRAVIPGVFHEGNLNEMLEAGIRSGVWLPGEAGMYSFNHNLLREAAYRLQSHSERTDLHLKAAGIMAELRADNPSGAAGTARHYELAGRPEEASSWYAKAGDYALSRRMKDSCVLYFEKVLELTSLASVRMNAYRQIYELHISSGELDLSLQVIERAQADPAVSHSAEYSIRLMRANYAINLGKPDEAGEILDGLDDVSPELEPELLHLRGRVLMLQGKTAEARDYLLGVYDKLKDGSEHCREVAHRALGNASGCMLRLEDNLPGVEEALKTVLAYSREIGSLMMETICVGNLALVYRYMGRRTEDSGKMIRRHLELARLTGSRLAELQALGNLASHLERLSPSAEVFSLYSQAIELAEKYAGSDSLSIAHANLADALCRVNRMDQSIYHFRKALDICYSQGLGLYLSQYTYELASVLIDAGDITAAGELLEKLVDLDAEENEYEQQILYIKARLHMARGDNQEAERLLRESLAVADRLINKLDFLRVKEKLDFLYLLAQVSDDPETLDEAVRCCELAIEKNPHWDLERKLAVLKGKA